MLSHLLSSTTNAMAKFEQQEPKIPSTLAWLENAKDDPSERTTPDSRLKAGKKDVKATADEEWMDVQTVMLRNIPNNYSQERLRWVFQHEGFEGTYDFFYLPIDGTRGHNRGYAFINFKECSYVARFYRAFHGKQLPSLGSHKVLTVCKASLQGYEANYDFFSSKSISRCGKAFTQPLFLAEKEPRSGRKADRGQDPWKPPGLNDWDTQKARSRKPHDDSSYETTWAWMDHSSSGHLELPSSCSSTTTGGLEYDTFASVQNVDVHVEAPYRTSHADFQDYSVNIHRLSF